MDVLSSLKKWVNTQIDKKQIGLSKRLKEQNKLYSYHGGNVRTPDTVTEFFIPQRIVPKFHPKTDISLSPRPNHVQVGSLKKADQILGTPVQSPEFRKRHFAVSPTSLALAKILSNPRQSKKHNHQDAIPKSPVPYTWSLSSSSSIASSSPESNQEPFRTRAMTSSQCSSNRMDRSKSSNRSTSVTASGSDDVFSASPSEDDMFTWSTGCQQIHGFRRLRTKPCGKDCKPVSKNVIRHSPPNMDELELFSNTNSDPQSEAAMSLDYLATKTCYGFSTLKEPPSYRRRESLFHSNDSVFTDPEDNDVVEDNSDTIMW